MARQPQSQVICCSVGLSACPEEGDVAATVLVGYAAGTRSATHPASRVKTDDLPS